MVQRCTNPSNHAWPEYGGAGITVADRWFCSVGGSFENFLIDLGERPEGTTLDRWPNPDGPYAPGNTQWSTPEQQARHTGPQKNGASSQYKGVSWNRRDGKWYARIQPARCVRYLGSFNDEKHAARAYDTAALEAWGADAWLNAEHFDLAA